MLKALALVSFFQLSAFAYKAECSDTVRANILKASNGSETAYVNCSLTLSSTDIITKKLSLRGWGGTNVKISCNGALIDNINDGTPESQTAIEIRSLEKNTGGWSQARNSLIEGCRINGDVRIKGRGLTVNDGLNKESSFSLGHTERMQEIAPYNITLRNLDITTGGPAHIYLGVGTTYVSVLNSRFSGALDGTSIYFGAESAYNTIKGNKFEGNSLKREQVAVDASAHNKILNNIFYNVKGGVFLYRNCGEHGAVRHQTPSHNVVSNNIFYNRGIFEGGADPNPGRDANYAIHVASRNGAPGYCGDDVGYDFGSSINDRDLAKDNAIAQNQIFNVDVTSTVVNDETPNYYFSNERVTSAIIRKSGCFNAVTKEFVLNGEISCLSGLYVCNDGDFIKQADSCGP